MSKYQSTYDQQKGKSPNRHIHNSSKYRDTSLGGREALNKPNGSNNGPSSGYISNLSSMRSFKKEPKEEEPICFITGFSAEET
jgi:hypothetical protein